MDTKGALDRLFSDIDENTRRESGEVISIWISRFVTTIKTLDAARAEIAEASAALDEAGEPRDDGEDALSLASRIRNVVFDRDENAETASGEARLRKQLALDVCRLTAERDAAVAERDALKGEVERVHRGCGVCGPESAGVIGELRAENERLQAIRAELCEGANDRGSLVNRVDRLAARERALLEWIYAFKLACIENGNTDIADAMGQSFAKLEGK